MMKELFISAVIFGLLSSTSAVYPYYGKLIQRGWGANAPQGLAGDIYAVDNDTIQIINFISANHPIALFGGPSRTFDQVANGGGVDNDAVMLARPNEVRNGNLIVNLPSGVLNDYKYIAVGDSATKRMEGGANIPQGFVPPAPQNIGRFVERAHQVRSGEVTVLNDRMILVRGFSYDGFGPDAFWYVGTTDRVQIQQSPYGKIPDENGVVDQKAGRYRNKDVILTLPDTISATDLKWLSMYCITYSHNFGEVTFPSNLNVPPYIEAQAPTQPQAMNCEQLSDKLQVSWLVSGDVITIELAGDIERDRDYMAFGLSGSSSTYSMIGADVVVADYSGSRTPRAVDYHITAYAQCAINGGVCPDVRSPTPGNNDVMSPTGDVTNGITRVRYQRRLVTNDGNRDQNYRTDRPQQVVWAIGPINSNLEAAKHYVGDRTSRATSINFGRPTADNCQAFARNTEAPKPPFKAHHLYGRPGQKTSFTAEIGQAGSEQGYKAITGLPSWGIAWYIDGILVPELHLQRGVTYTFRIGGGTNPSAGAMYHPFYFTNSAEGGYSQSNTGAIYPGTVNNALANFAVGDYCEWKLNPAGFSRLESGHVYQCFEEFQQDLFLECENNPTRYTEFKFTPNQSTPDTIYYQCYTHKNLGWKVHIYDQLPATDIQTESCTSPSTTPSGQVTTTSDGGEGSGTGFTTSSAGGGVSTAGEQATTTGRMNVISVNSVTTSEPTSHVTKLTNGDSTTTNSSANSQTKTSYTFTATSKMKTSYHSTKTSTSTKLPIVNTSNSDTSTTNGRGVTAQTSSSGTQTATSTNVLTVNTSNSDTSTTDGRGVTLQISNSITQTDSNTKVLTITTSSNVIKSSTTSTALLPRSTSTRDPNVVRSSCTLPSLNILSLIMSSLMCHLIQLI